MEDDGFDLEECIQGLGSQGMRETEFKEPINVRDFVSKGNCHFQLKEGGVSLNGEDYDDFDERVLVGMNPRSEQFGTKTAQDCLVAMYNNLLQDLDGRDINSYFKEQRGRGEESFEELEKGMKNVTQDGGLKKRTILPGFGPLVRPGKVVYVDYMITYEEGDETQRLIKVVDCSRVPTKDGGFRNQWDNEFRFKLGAGNVIPMLEKGVATMKIGETAEFLASPKYAFGKMGLYNEVPPHTTVMLHVGVKRAMDGVEGLQIWEMDSEDREKLPVKLRLAAAQELKQYGNDEFKKKEWYFARAKYKKAISILSEITTPIDSEMKEKEQLRYTLFTNLAQCRIQNEEYRKAVTCLECALQCKIEETKKLKAYYHLAKAHFEWNHVEKAYDYIHTAKAMNTIQPEIDELLDKIEEKLENDKRVEKELLKKMVTASISKTN